MLEKIQEKIDSLDYSRLSSFTIENCKNITLVTSVMDRTEFLNLSLQTWKKFPFKEIIIVDWSSKIPLEIPDVTVVYVPNQKYYLHSKVRNFKTSLSNTNIVLSIDCDILLMPNFLNNIHIKEHIFYSVNTELVDNIIGTSIYDKRDYFKIGGCNELMDYGWGYEDMDLYNKFKENNITNIKLLDNQFFHIPHSDELRVINTVNKDKWKSNSMHMKISAINNEYKNPIFKEKYTIIKNGKKEYFNV